MKVGRSRMILDGKTIKNHILDELREEVSNMTVKPSFVVIQVGDNEASNVYIKQKSKMAEYIGYDYLHLNHYSMNIHIII